LLKLDDYEVLPVIDLTEQWYNIYEQWSEIIGGHRADLSVLGQKRKLAMRHLWNVHASLLRAVAILPVPEMIELCRKEGYKIDIKNLAESLKVANGKLQRKKAQIELDDLNDNKEEKVDFDNLIVELEKFQGYGFDEKQMMVRKFANIYKKYKAQSDGRRKNKT
jgi:hypothetical protein